MTKRLALFVLFASLAACGQVTLSGTAQVRGTATVGIATGGGGGGGALTASMNLCGGSVTDFAMGNIESGSLSSPLTVTITNNCGSPYTFAVQQNVFSETLTNESRHNGHQGVARNYRDNCPGMDPNSPNTIGSGSSCTMDFFLIAGLPGTTRGMVYLTNTSTGATLSTVSMVGTAVTPANISSLPTLPTGITAVGDGTYTGHTYNPSYPGDGTCKGGVGGIISTAAALTSALSTIAQGDTLCILQGSAGASGQFTVPDTGNPASTAWIHIRISDASGNVPAGVPTFAEGFSNVDNPTKPHATVSSSGSGQIVFNTACGSHHVWIGPGLEITSGSGHDSVVLVGGCFQGPTFNTPSTIPHDIVVERNWIHPAARGIMGAGMGNGVFGVSVVSNKTMIVNNWIQSFGLQEYQAVADCGHSQLRITNNYLEATAENVFTGGCAPPMVGLHPTDVEIRGNWLNKQQAWNIYDPSYAGLLVIVKNLFEMKNVDRVLFEGNFSQRWWGGQGQTSGAFLLGAGNQSGSDFDSYQRHVTVANNLWTKIGWFFSMVSSGYIEPTQANYNVLVRDNLVFDMGAPWEAPDGNDEAFSFSAPGWVIPQPTGTYTVATKPTGTFNWTRNTINVSDGVNGTDCNTGGGATLVRCFYNGSTWAASASAGTAESKPFWNLRVEHVTVMPAANSSFAKNEMNGLPAAKGSTSTFKCNITRVGTYGYFAYDINGNLQGSDGDSWISLGFPDAVSPVWKNGVVGTNPGGNWNTNNWLFQSNDTAAGFTNPGTNDWSLQVSSPWHNACPDGKDIGADVALVNSRVSGIGTLPFTRPTVTSTSPTNGVKTGGVALTVNGTSFSANSAIYLGGPSTLDRHYTPNYAFKPVTTFSSSGTTVTATLDASFPNLFYVGDSITVTNTSGLNGTYTITGVTDNRHFTFTKSSPPPTDSGNIQFAPIATTVAGVECAPLNTGLWTSTQIQCTTGSMPAGYGTGRPVNVVVIEKGEWISYQSYTLN